MSQARAPSDSNWVELKADRQIREELAVLLFGSVGPTAIITASLTVLSAMSATGSDGGMAVWMPILAGLVGTARVATVVAFRLQAEPRRHIDRWEAVYSVGLLAFSLLVGVFCLNAFQDRDPMTQMMAITILVGFCAGVVARISVRPLLAAAAVSTASLSAVAGCVLAMTPEYLAVGAVLFALMVGSLQTVRETYRNILQNHVLRRRFEDLAGLDPLTGLFNRGILYRKLDALLSGGQTPLAVHFVDLDRFKAVNDTHGHAAGDAVLREVAGRLSALVGGGGMIASRLGGDEFVVVQPETASAGDAQAFGQRIVAAVAQPYLWNGTAIEIGTSVGCVHVDQPGMTAASAIALADAALYAAKQKGRSRLVMARPSALAA